jgi:hypothetical protein
MKTFVVVKLRFEAIHCWPDCPFLDVFFLKTPHRHEFWVEVKIPVQHDDRDVEFIRAKRELQTFVRVTYADKDLGAMSCEMIAREILSTEELSFDRQSVSVFEDGENGAVVER